MNKFLQANYAPIFEENDIEEIRNISGEIPAELNGILYRNGPNPQFPNENQHWFKGDGMLHQFIIGNSKVSYRNRWVLTERFKMEREAGEALFGNLGSVKSERYDLSKVPHNTANTNIILHGNKLLALQETSCPIEINARDLSTLGQWNYEGKVPQMSAHPHFDYESGEMHNFAHTPGSSEIIYYIFDKNNQVIKAETITGPFSCFMHDFFITKHYAIFLFLPLTINLERAKQGSSVVMWEPEFGSHIAIMPRHGRANDITWFNSDAFHAYHYMNAYEEDNRIILDGMKSMQAGLFPDKTGKVPSDEQCTPKLTRWFFDLQRQQVAELQLDCLPAEFPRFDERFTGTSYQHGFVTANIRPKQSEYEALIHYDLKTGSQKVCDFGHNNIPSEPVFVPRNSVSSEGDGFILTVVYQADKNISDLYILDAMNIDKKPLAIVHLPLRVPHGFHGNWYDF